MKAGVSLPIQLELCKVRIRVKKPRVKVIQVHWPCLSMKSWAQVMLNRYPQFMLGGLEMEQESEWKQMFESFWAAYRGFDPTHEVFQHEGVSFCTLIPYFLHGDEGRGARSLPFMVESWQVVIPFSGVGTTTVSGHSLCSRMLFTCVSSKLYAGEHTLRDINAEWTRQMLDMYHEGVQEGIIGVCQLFVSKKTVTWRISSQLSSSL